MEQKTVNTNEFYSMRKIDFYLYFIVVLLWAVCINLVLYSRHAVESIGDQIFYARIACALGAALVLIYVLCSTVKYVVSEEQITIFTIFGTKLPFYIVGGPRFSHTFAFPFGIIPNTIKFSNITRIRIDTYLSNTPSINIKIASGNQFRLCFFNENKVQNISEGKCFEMYQILKANEILSSHDVEFSP